MRIIPIGQSAEPQLSPDLIWNGTSADLVIDQRTGGFQSNSAIATAVLICLQTDRRVDISEVPDGETNRGWPGDAFDMADDVPLGSKLWLLRRRTVTEEVRLLAEDYARGALQTLVDQRVVVRVDVTATIAPTRNRLDLDVALYGREGSQAYQKRFAVLWDQIDGA